MLNYYFGLKKDEVSPANPSSAGLSANNCHCSLTDNGTIYFLVYFCESNIQLVPLSLEISSLALIFMRQKSITLQALKKFRGTFLEHSLKRFPLKTKFDYSLKQQCVFILPSKQLYKRCYSVQPRQVSWMLLKLF